MLDPFVSAQVCWISEFIRIDFPRWIHKSIPALCGPELINDDHIIVALNAIQL